MRKNDAACAMRTLHLFDPAATTPEEFARHIGAEIERWGKMIRESGIRAE